MRAHHRTTIRTSTLLAALALASPSHAAAAPPPTSVLHSNQADIWEHSNQHHGSGVGSLITARADAEFWTSYLDGSRLRTGVPGRPDVLSHVPGPDRHGNNPRPLPGLRGGRSGAAVTGGPLVNAVPAPGGLFLLGLCAAFGRRRRRTGRVSAPHSQR